MLIFYWLLLTFIYLKSLKGILLHPKWITLIPGFHCFKCTTSYCFRSWIFPPGKAFINDFTFRNDLLNHFLFIIFKWLFLISKIFLYSIILIITSILWDYFLFLLFWKFLIFKRFFGYSIEWSSINFLTICFVCKVISLPFSNLKWIIQLLSLQHTLINVLSLFCNSIDWK